MREMNKQMSPQQALLDLTVPALQHYRMYDSASNRVAKLSVDESRVG